MPINLVSTTITETPFVDKAEFDRTGVARGDQFAVRGSVDQLKQIKFNPDAQVTNTSVTISSQASTSGIFKLPNMAGGNLIGEAAAYQYSAPIAAATVTISANKPYLIVDPAGTLATLTIVLPTTPADGYIQRFSASAELTALTLNGGGSDTISNAVTALAAGDSAGYLYKADVTKWFRIQ